MPHLRSRHLITLLEKRLRLSPVVAIQGVRQCGKSTLARDLLPSAQRGAYYQTLDQPSALEYAERNPESFIEESNDSLLIIDEAQKAPVLFNAIKFSVDRKWVPGRFLLLGSTEFSTLMRIRESLTGRISRVRLFPMTIAESLGLTLSSEKHPFFLSEKPRISRAQFLRFLIRGGMPGLFHLRDDSEFRQRLQDWIALTVERDALQIPSRKIVSDRVFRVLHSLATLPEPEAGRISKVLRLSPLMVKSVLEVLKTLFVVHEIQPSSFGAGKPRYYLCDPAVARALGASHERLLETAFYLEFLAKFNAYGYFSPPFLSYYRTSKGSVVHGIWENGGEFAALKLIPDERIDERELQVLFSLAKKADGSKKISLIALYGGSSPQLRRKVGLKILPWDCMG